MPYESVMRLPVRTFWFMNYTINRIRAESDMRGLSLNANAQGSEQAKSYREHLMVEMGEVIVQSKDGVFDQEGLDGLRALA